VLHLHGLEHDELRPCGHRCALRGDLDDDSAQLRPHRLSVGVHRRRRRVRCLGEVGDPIAEPAGVHNARAKRPVGQDGSQQRDARGDALDDEVSERGVRLACGGGKVGRGVRDDLREQRVVARTRREAGKAEGVDAHARSAGRRESRQLPGGREHRAVVADGLNVHPPLDRNAPGGSDPTRNACDRRTDALGKTELGKLSAPRDGELHRDQVHAGDFLGDGVLDLDARVDLEEHEAVVFLVGHQELHRRQAAVVHLGAQPCRCLVQTATCRGVQLLRGRDLDELLVPALHAAVPVAQGNGHGGTVRIRGGHDLHFDVPGPLPQRLSEQLRSPERQLCLRRARAVCVIELRGRSYRPHSAAAAPGQRLDHDAAGLRGKELPHLVQGDRTVGRRQDGNPDRDGGLASRGLVAEPPEQLRAGADEGMAGFDTGFGELRVLGQKPVAGMHQCATGTCSEHRRLIEIGRRTGARQRDGLRRRSHVRAVCVVLRVHRDRVDTELGGRTDDAQCDLATVRDQQHHRNDDT